jgi:hypothetical protein
MKKQVEITDTRPKWMKREDEWMICFERCPLFRRCQTRNGKDCKHQGGSAIPKIR